MAKLVQTGSRRAVWFVVTEDDGTVLYDILVANYRRTAIDVYGVVFVAGGQKPWESGYHQIPLSEGGSLQKLAEEALAAYQARHDEPSNVREAPPALFTSL